MGRRTSSRAPPPPSLSHWPPSDLVAWCENSAEAIAMRTCSCRSIARRRRSRRPMVDHYRYAKWITQQENSWFGALVRCCCAGAGNELRLRLLINGVYFWLLRWRCFCQPDGSFLDLPSGIYFSIEHKALANGDMLMKRSAEAFGKFPGGSLYSSTEPRCSCIMWCFQCSLEIFPHVPRERFDRSRVLFLSSFKEPRYYSFGWCVCCSFSPHSGARVLFPRNQISWSSFHGMDYRTHEGHVPEYAGLLAFTSCSERRSFLLHEENW